MAWALIWAIIWALICAIAWLTIEPIVRILRVLRVPGMMLILFGLKVEEKETGVMEENISASRSAVIPASSVRRKNLQY